MSHSEPKCPHCNCAGRLAKLIAANGTTQYRLQCAICGCVVGKSSIPHADLTEAQRSAAVDFDRDLQSEFWSAKAAAKMADRQRKNDDWWDKYEEYLSDSPQWRVKRELVMEKYDRICQGCLKRRATQVHHLTYKHVFDELLFELIPVCDECHKKIHTDAGAAKGDQGVY